MRAVVLGAMLGCAGCLSHGEHYDVFMSPDFTVEQVEGIKAGGADWQKWVHVSFDYHWGNQWLSACETQPYSMCVYPVSKEVFDAPEKTWGLTTCSHVSSDSCLIELATDWHLPAIEWQALAAHEMGHAMGFRRPDWPNNGHEDTGSGALMAPTLESVTVTCIDMARWYTVRHEVVPPCP